MNVQNKINDLSKDIYAYYEYERVAEAMNEQFVLAGDSYKVTLICSLVSVAGVILIEIYFLKKFKSVIMMLKLIGINKNKTLCISLMNAIWQIMIIICMALVIYLIASIPQILQLLNVANITDIIVSLPGFYLAFNALCSFKLLHFVYLFIMIVLAVLVSNIIMFSYYNSKIFFVF